MKFDVGILGSQPVATIVKQAQLAESLGFDTVWITDTHGLTVLSTVAERWQHRRDVVTRG